MNYTCELRNPKTNRVMKDKIAKLRSENRNLSIKVPSQYNNVFSRFHIFGEKGVFELNGKIAHSTIPLLIKCVENLELGVNTYAELDIVKRLREMATTEPDAIWSVY